MVELIVEDEYGRHYTTETFLTVQDAKDYLNVLDSALDDADTSTEVYRLRGLISQLEESIMEAELQEEE